MSKSYPLNSIVQNDIVKYDEIYFRGQKTEKVADLSKQNNLLKSKN